MTATEDDLHWYLLERAYNLISIRPRSVHEMRTRLGTLSQKKSASTPDVAIENTIAILIKNKLLDDTAFSRWLTESRMRHSQRGKKLIEKELSQLGVDDQVVETVLGETTPDKEKEPAMALVVKKQGRWLKLPRREYQDKLWQLLLRHGFTSSTIRTVVDEAVQMAYNKR